MNFIHTALSGILFPGEEEAAYSNFRLWESTGSAITYAYNPYLCTNIKLYLLLGLLLIGVTGYTIVEVTENRVRSKELQENGENKGSYDLTANGSDKKSELPENWSIYLCFRIDTWSMFVYKKDLSDK